MARLELRLFDLAGFEGLDGYPHALHLTTGETHAHTLQIWFKRTFGRLYQLQANAAALLTQSFVDYASAFMRLFTCYCTNSCHNDSKCREAWENAGGVGTCQ